MKEGGLKKKRGCLIAILAIFAGPPLAGILLAPFYSIYETYVAFSKEGFWSGIEMFLYTLVIFGIYYGVFLIYRKFKRRKKGISPNKRQPIKPHAVELSTTSGKLTMNNPFRGIFVVGAAGSGKSESIAVPLLQQFIRKGYSGLTYDFKFPSLANDIEAFSCGLRHFYLNFNNPYQSYRVNPLNVKYLPNTSYAREYSQAIISNLMKESINRPDFWTRSATDLLTACIWYLRSERPDICDLPHLFAMVTSDDVALLELLHQNGQSAQMTVSIYNAMKRGADSQVSGVIGTLQGAIAQINTPELMYIFSGDDFSLDVNDPENPILLTVGSYPTLTSTFAPLCSLIITVATKLMNQPNKANSFVLLDEAPTIFIPNIEVLPNTGRSNKVSTVIMCQDLAQLTDSYGREKSDVLFAACNNHFYGRVSSSVTADVLSRQFGKSDKVFTTAGRSSTELKRSFSESETVQERDIIKGSDFLRFGVGQFAGVLVESNTDHFNSTFMMSQRPPRKELTTPPMATFSGMGNIYQTVRYDVDKMLSPFMGHDKGKSPHRGESINRFDLYT